MNNNLEKKDLEIIDTDLRSNVLEIDSTVASISTDSIPYNEENIKDYLQYSQYEKTDINWLIKGKIARGNINVIAGEPDVGKSWFTTWLASIVSTGGIFPLTGEHIEKGNVILQNAEDGISDTILHRLEKHGANQNNIYHINEKTKILKIQDIDRIRAIMEELQPILIIVDPIQAFMGDADSNRQSDVRGALEPLRDLAQEFDCAIVMVMHFNKEEDKKAINRVNGSKDYINASRSCLTIIKNPANDQERLVVPFKTNIIEDKYKTTLSFKITSDNGVVWLEDKGLLNIDRLESESNNKTNTNKSDYAKGFIMGCLSIGDIGGNELIENAINCDITERTLNGARAELSKLDKIDSYRIDNKNYWRIKESTTE